MFLFVYVILVHNINNYENNIVSYTFNNTVDTGIHVTKL